MKKIILILSFVFLYQFSFAQISFPDVYVDDSKIETDTISGFFTPVRFEFKFPKNDFNYVIKKGAINYGIKKTVFTGNTVNTQYVTNFFNSLDVEITKIEFWKDNKLVKTEAVNLSKKINLKRVFVINDKQIDAINSNDYVITINDKLFNPSQKYSFDMGSVLSIANKSGDKTRGIKKIEIIAVREKRPVAVTSVADGSNLLDIGSFKDRAVSGDFCWIKITESDDAIVTKVFYRK